jgi:hypothetical protein
MSQEFGKITKLEDVCEIAQETLNIIVNETRLKNYGERSDEIESTIAINQIAATNVETYLKRKSRVFLSCIWKPFKKEGMETFLDLVSANETEMHQNRSKRLESIIKAFPSNYKDAAGSYNENVNRLSNEITHILKADLTWTPVEDITTKELQWILKSALNRIESIKWPENLETIDTITFRKNCKNTKLRNIHFRMVHSDFYTQQRMFKYKMTNDPNCTRCGNTETTKHLLWECQESQNIWKLYNEILDECFLGKSKIVKYENIYETDSVAILSIIKTKIIQEFIQIKRPTNWVKGNIAKIIINLRNIEMYNANKIHTLSKTKQKWKYFLHLNDEQTT